MQCDGRLTAKTCQWPNTGERQVHVSKQSFTTIHFWDGLQAQIAPYLFGVNHPVRSIYYWNLPKMTDALITGLHKRPQGWTHWVLKWVTLLAKVLILLDVLKNKPEHQIDRSCPRTVAIDPSIESMLAKIKSLLHLVVSSTFQNKKTLFNQGFTGCFRCLNLSASHAI